MSYLKYIQKCNDCQSKTFSCFDHEKCVNCGSGNVVRTNIKHDDWVDSFSEEGMKLKNKHLTKG
jgi:rRNA maturation endonuclease Nob1